MSPPMGARHALIGARTVGVHAKVSELTAEVLRRESRRAEMSLADFIATVLEIRAHGKLVVERIAAARVEIVSSPSPPRVEE